MLQKPHLAVKTNERQLSFKQHNLALRDKLNVQCTCTCILTVQCVYMYTEQYVHTYNNNTLRTEPTTVPLLR